MYNLDPINQQARPNTVYVEGLSAAARIAPEQGRLLGLRAGQIINGIIAQRPEGNVLLFDNNGGHSHQNQYHHTVIRTLWRAQ